MSIFIAAQQSIVPTTNMVRSCAHGRALHTPNHDGTKRTRTFLMQQPSNDEMAASVFAQLIPTEDLLVVSSAVCSHKGQGPSCMALLSTSYVQMYGFQSTHGVYRGIARTRLIVQVLFVKRPSRLQGVAWRAMRVGQWIALRSTVPLKTPQYYFSQDSIVLFTSRMHPK